MNLEEKKRMFEFIKDHVRITVESYPETYSSYPQIEVKLFCQDPETEKLVEISSDRISI